MMFVRWAVLILNILEGTLPKKERPWELWGSDMPGLLFDPIAPTITLEFTSACCICCNNKKH